MASRELLILLLCLLLLQAQGSLRRRKAQAGIKKKARFTVPPRVITKCEKHVSAQLCSYHCQRDRECQANNICCSTFCGNVCMSVL